MNMFLSLSVPLLSDQGDECVEATPRGRRVSEGRRDRRRVDNSVGVFPCLLFSRSFFVVVVVVFLPLLQLLLPPLCFSTNSSAAGRRRGRGERGEEEGVRSRRRALAPEERRLPSPSQKPSPAPSSPPSAEVKPPLRLRRRMLPLFFPGASSSSSPSSAPPRAPKRPGAPAAPAASAAARPP